MSLEDELILLLGQDELECLMCEKKPWASKTVGTHTHMKGTNYKKLLWLNVLHCTIQRIMTIMDYEM